MKNIKYSECIEFEKLDPLINSNSSELVTAVLLFFVNVLNTDKELNHNYQFNVISYGFAGYYPVIGVEYKHENARPIEKSVIDRFEDLGEKISMNELLHFWSINSKQILELIKEISEDNSQRSSNSHM